MRGSQLRSGLIIGLILAIFFVFALWLRAYPPFDKVFTGGWVKFTGVDAYYHMYIVDNLVHNFPNLTSYLPYMLYPAGQGTGTIHFFDWLLALVIQIVGLGSPTQHTIDVVGVFYPAVLGALTVIPVFFIGKALLGRWAGLIAAGLIAILPGEFLGRSILGSTDHHVAETLFSATSMLFLILALKSARQRQLSFEQVKRMDWDIIARPILYSVLAGLFLSLYLLTFIGGLLFVFIIFLCLGIQFVIDHLKRRPTTYLSFTGIVLFIIALAIFWPVGRDRLTLVSLAIAVIVAAVLGIVSWFMAGKKLKPAYYPLTIAILGLIALGIFYLAAPSLFRSMVASFGILIPRGASLTTLEMQPIFSPGGKFTFSLIWGNFTLSFFFGLFALGLLVYQVIKRGEADKSTIVIWSLLILAATIAQRRYAYYFAANIAIHNGYLSARGLQLTGLTKPAQEAQRVTTAKAPAGRRARPSRRSSGVTLSHVNLGLALLIIFMAVFFPNVIPAAATASSAQFAPSDAWMSTLTWLKDNTPDPFGDPDAYYRLETRHQYASLSDLLNTPNPSGDSNFYSTLPGSYPYPDSAYGVMAWWDYGYWITRIAHRIPNANPSQDPQVLRQIATYFTSQNETASDEIPGKMGTAYVVIDSDTAMGKFWAVATWAGKEPSQFFDMYYVPGETANQLQAVQLFHPEYYQSMVIRLYNFNGEAVTPSQVVVVSYEDRLSQKGETIKLVTGVQQFDTYEEAEVYLQSQESGKHRIVGLTPFSSPVPLEALQGYKLVYSSNQTMSLGQGESIPQLKVFEYAGRVKTGS
ncbi:MAG: oligosaccharyl transferase, archaeosortase A system-associated [Chloroflexi bacterium]|nr:oligosaccharyl transferase, archaeosortase A system-associated [Chloroflexota bacterium]